MKKSSYLQVKVISTLLAFMMLFTTSFGMVGVAQAAAPMPADRTLPSVLTAVEQVLNSMNEEEWNQFLNIRDQFYDSQGQLKDDTVNDIVSRLQQIGLADEFEGVINSNITVADAKFIISVLANLGHVGRDNVAESVTQVSAEINQLKAQYNVQVQKLLNRGINQEKAYQFIIGVNSRLDQNTIKATDDFETIMIQAALDELRANNGQTHPELYQLVQDSLTRLRAKVADNPLLGAIIPSTVAGITPAMVQTVIDSGLQGIDNDGGLVDLLDTYNSFVGVLARFYIDPTIPPGGGGGGGGAVKSSPTFSDSAVKNAIALAAKAGAVTLQAPSNATQLSLNPDQLKLIVATGKPLNVKIGDVTITVPSAVLQAQDFNLNDVNLIQFNASNVTAGVQASNAGLFNVAGQIFDFSIDVELKDGTKKYIHTFNENVGISMPVPANYRELAAQGSLTVGYFNEQTKAWEDMSGQYDAATGTIGCATGHFSKFAVLEVKRAVFNDIAAHWAKDDIEFMAAKGFAGGVGNGLFAPDANITRAQFAAFLVRVLGVPEVAGNLNFTDVKAGDWYYNTLATAYNAGLIKGVSADKIAPNDNITREQMAVMIVRAMEYKSKTIPAAAELTFTDKGLVSAWATAGVSQASQLTLVGGFPDGTFAPKANATRAQAIVMLHRVYNQVQ